MSFLTRNLLLYGLVAASTAPLFAGGPKYIAGSTYFQSSVMGTPLHWANGQVRYYVDQGPLSATVSNQQATALVDAAAALWSTVPTAGINLTDAGSLAENVSGANVAVGNQSFTAPADVTPSATSFPVGVIYDTDGSVLDTLNGTGASDPDSCQTTAVTVWLDAFQANATMTHAVMILNGRCTATTGQMAMMQFALERAWGQILGLGFSQIYPHAATSNNVDQMQAWPIMQPMMGVCGPGGGTCIPNPGTLRLDDVAALNRIYPITAANAASFPGKQLTAANTVSISGTIAFKTGVGMQGVNVLATPLDASGNPMVEYTVSTVSGASFSGNHGSDVTGWKNANGVLLSQWGSTDATQQGAFDLRYIPLPPGVTAAGYQLTFEAIDSLYIYENTVGPYVDGSPDPSGTLAPVTVKSMTAGGAQTVTVKAEDSAAGGYDDAISTESSPRLMPPGGLWAGRLSAVSQADWFNFPVRGNRLFTVVTQAVDETGSPSSEKAMPAMGIWDALDAVGSAAIGTAPGLNGNATGETWLQVTAAADDIVRLGIADMRGDGRPDYAYNGWVLYADTVAPANLPASGGPIVIEGMGFRPSDTVKVNGQPAQITGISPNEITAIAPASTTTGAVDVEVDDLPQYYAAAVIYGGISYNAGGTDSLKLVTAPQNTVPIGVPIPFTVTALDGNLVPVAGVTVAYTVTSGTAVLGCGKTSCAVTATGDGSASMTVTAADGTASVVTATLTNGAQLQAHFSGGTPPVLAALTPMLSLAAGATIAWPTQAIVLNNGTPMGGQAVAWQATSGSGIATQDTTVAITAESGIAAKTLTAGPLTEGETSSAKACLNGTSQCVTFNAIGARPEYATVEAVSGTSQSLAVGGTPSQIVLRVRDMDGNPMAGGTVALFQSVYAWSPPCPTHGVCAQAELLATETSTATSALDGTVAFTPAGIPGVATNVVSIAVTGNSGSTEIALEIHP